MIHTQLEEKERNGSIDMNLFSKQRSTPFLIEGCIVSKAQLVHQSKYEPRKILEKDTNSEISSFILPAWELSKASNAVRVGAFQANQ